MRSLLLASVMFGASAGALPPAPAPPPCPRLSNISAFFVDLDGTMYEPGGLLPGARSFVSWMEKTKKPFVFLSNSGAKGAAGVRPSS